MSDEIVIQSEFEYSEEDVVIDPHTCDLNLIVDKECLLAYPLSNDGFCMMWAGCKSTYGVSSGRILFEVFLSDYCESEDLPKEDPDNYAIRIGWSINGSTLQLGEDLHSYAFSSYGKKCTNSVIEEYGETFEKGDAIASYIDFESDSNNIEISFSKNGVDLGLAYKIPKCEIINNKNVNFEAFYPHVLSKNVVFEINFGQRISVLGDEPFAPINTNFEFINKIPLEKRVKYENVIEKEKNNCEVIMLIGLPACGKTTWAINYYKKMAHKCYFILGLSTIIDKMKMSESKKRLQVTNTSSSTSTASASKPSSNTNVNSTNVNNSSSTAGPSSSSSQTQQEQKQTKANADLIDKASKCMNRLIEVASKLNRNIILDQNNVYASARRRKMKKFEGYKRKAVVIVPNDDEYKERLKKVENDECRDITQSMIYDMKANFTLPEVGPIFDSVEYAELSENVAKELIERYNAEGQEGRLQLVLNKRIKTDEEKKLLASKAGITNTKLVRPTYGYGYGYGYGNNSNNSGGGGMSGGRYLNNRTNFSPMKRPYIPQQNRMNRFGQQQVGIIPPSPQHMRLPYLPQYPPQMSWNGAVMPLSPQWPSANWIPQQPQQQQQQTNNWNPALPISPYPPTTPTQQAFYWPMQQPSAWPIVHQTQQIPQQAQAQQQQQQQQPQTQNMWQPAVTTNIYTPAMATNVTNSVTTDTNKN